MVREHLVLVIEPNSSDDLTKIISILDQHTAVQGCELGDNSVRVVMNKEVEDYSDLPKTLMDQGVYLKQFYEEELDLESAFMALTKGTSNRM